MNWNKLSNLKDNDYENLLQKIGGNLLDPDRSFGAGAYLLIGIGSSPLILPFLGLIAILFGVLFLQIAYFIVNDDSLVFHVLLGPARRTYKFASLKELEIENNNIFMTANGKRSRFISGW